MLRLRRRPAVDGRFSRWPVLRRGQSLWSDRDDARPARSAAWVGSAIAAACFLLLATGGQPWRLFERGPFTSDFYDVQARALAQGHLDVPPEVAGIEGFPTASGTHFYFGLVPALARLPVSVATDRADGRLVVLSMVMGVMVAALAGARILQRARAALPDAPTLRSWPLITGAFAFAVGCSSPLLWLSADALVYHEAEMWGAALALVAFDQVLAWWTSRRTVDLAWASAFATLAWSSRSTSGAGPALALGVLALMLTLRRHWRLAAAAAAAAAVPLLAYAAVNVARFDTPVSIPLQDQLTTQFSDDRRAALADNGGSLFGVKFVPTAVVQYLRPDTLATSALFPWFTWGAPADPIGDVTYDTVDRSASLPVTAPFFVTTTVAGMGVIVRRRLLAWGLCLVAATVATTPTLGIAFIAQRYLADFVPGLVLGAAVGTAALTKALSLIRTPTRSIVVVGVAALIATGMVVNAGLAVLARQVYLFPDQAERRGFVAWQYSLHERLGGGPPPHVTQVSTLGPVAADGDVVIVGACDSLYRSDGTEWRLLEQRSPGRHRVMVTGNTPGTIVSGDGWSIDLVTDAADQRLEYRGARTVTSAPLIGAGPWTVDISADPTVPVVTASVGGRQVLVAFLDRAAGQLRPTAAWKPRTAAAQLCEILDARLS